jgi:hypothetical protein
MSTKNSRKTDFLITRGIKIALPEARFKKKLGANFMPTEEFEPSLCWYLAQFAPTGKFASSLLLKTSYLAFFLWKILNRYGIGDGSHCIYFLTAAAAV